MIVRSVDEGWGVVFHTSHGLLAQRIASHLESPRALPFWFETQIAIGAHDDLHRVYIAGKREHLTTAGAPRDFTLIPLREESRVEEMRDRIDEAYRKHTWIGLLQSKHADSLYRGEDVGSEMVAMLDAEAKRRLVAIKSLSVEEAALQQSYDWMRFCDRLSLILCGNDIPAMTRQLEISTDSSGKRSTIWQNEDEVVTIVPWPFVPEDFTLSIEYRSLKQLWFVDDADLGRQLREAIVDTRKFRMSLPGD